jgi:DNA-binding NarL/FixJ family response regulator
MIRVLVADNHPIVRDGLRFILARAGDIRVVAEAGDGAEALKLAASHAVDVFILDITMPGVNGLSAARALLARDGAAKIIMLSLNDTRAFVDAALAAGARGYLTKTTASQLVVHAVREVHAGRRYLGPDVARAGANPASRGRALTLQEGIVLQLLGEGRTVLEIARQLGRSVNTVRAHRRNLMAKLDVHKQTELVRLAIREGLAKP